MKNPAKQRIDASGSAKSASGIAATSKEDPHFKPSTAARRSAPKVKSNPVEYGLGGPSVADDVKTDGLPFDGAFSEVTSPDDRWISPSAAAAMLDVPEGWLAALREGRKGIDGPPFIKLGEGRTAPIRYNLGKYRTWIKSFPMHLTTSGKLYSHFSTAQEFFVSESFSARWLFANVDGELLDIATAINRDAFSGEADPKVSWLNIVQWMARQSKNRHHSWQLSDALHDVRQLAVRMHTREQRSNSP